MRRAWTRLLLGASAMSLLTGSTATSRQQVRRATQPLKRANELTLAGLRPGKDTAAMATVRYKRGALDDDGGTEYRWNDECRHEILYAVIEQSGKIQELRVTAGLEDSKFECAAPGRSPWRTGRDLAVGDAADRAVDLYGEPTSRSPSTKDGRQLELLYYAFDWAGPDVPQILTVLCTVQKNGKPGRVIEITLEASSL